MNFNFFISWAKLWQKLSMKLYTWVYLTVSSIWRCRILDTCFDFYHFACLEKTTTYIPYSKLDMSKLTSCQGHYTLIWHKSVHPILHSILSGTLMRIISYIISVKAWLKKYWNSMRAIFFAFFKMSFKKAFSQLLKHYWNKKGRLFVWNAHQKW